MQNFKHRSLDTNSNEIRLLRIKPTEEGESIVLELRHANLDDKVPFNALSYAWGDATPTYDIVIRDGSTEASFSVRENLYTFLRTAGKSTGDWSREWIWIDQVCINQNDHTERCHQVAQMATLYSTAQATIVWPGTRPVSSIKTPESDMAENSRPFFSPKELEAIRSTPVKFTIRPEQIPSESAMRLLEICTRGMLLELIERPYWRRLWIVQEIVLAAQPRVMIADDIWEFNDFCLVFTVLVNNFNHLRLSKHAGLGRALYRVKHRFALIDLHRHAQQDKIARLHSGWEFAIFVGAYSECTVPSDRIYGVMGLLPKGLRVEPDYTISQRDLLRNIIQKQMTFQVPSLHYNWFRLNDILRSWNDMSKYGFEPIEPVGLIPETHARDAGTLGSAEQEKRMEHNVRCYLRELEIPIPADMEAVSPSKRQPRSRDFVEKQWNISRKWLVTKFAPQKEVPGDYKKEKGGNTRLQKVRVAFHRHLGWSRG